MRLQVNPIFYQISMVLLFNYHRFPVVRGGMDHPPLFRNNMTYIEDLFTLPGDHYELQCGHCVIKSLSYPAAEIPDSFLRSLQE